MSLNNTLNSTSSIFIKYKPEFIYEVGVTIHTYIRDKTRELSPVEREERYKYLGKEVIDINDPGLDSIPEFYGIANAIWSDWRERK